MGFIDEVKEICYKTGPQKIITWTAIIIGVFLIMGWDTKKDNEQAQTEQEQQIEQETHDIPKYKISTASWENHAIIGNVNPIKVQEIRFTTQKPHKSRSAWLFDGIECYEDKDGIIYVLAKNLKITGSMRGAFSGMENLKRIYGLDSIDTSEVNDMSHMFDGDIRLENIDISKLKTDNALMIDGMFNGCESLSSIDISSLNLKNVVSMDSLFAGCRGLNHIILNEHTSNVKSMKKMFYQVGGKGLGLCEIKGTLNTKECQNMENMFSESNIVNLNNIVENLDTSSLIVADRMFEYSDINQVDLSKWETKNLESSAYLFNRCKALKKCTINWDAPKLEDVNHMFSECFTLYKLDFQIEHPEKIKNAKRMFNECYDLREIDLSSFNNCEFDSTEYMFAFNEKLKTIKLDNFKSKNANNMFVNCEQLDKSIEIFQLDPSLEFSEFRNQEKEE